MTQKLIIGSLAAAAVLAAGCSSSGGGTNAAGGNSTASSPSVSSSAPAASTVGITVSGGHLVGADGHALYTFSTDTSTTFGCTGSCLTEWPPVSGTAKPGAGLDSGDFGTAARPDGTKQVTYDGHPLYEFAGDKTAMDTNGNGVKDDGGTWNLAVSDDATTSPSSPASSSSSSGGGGGGGYGY